MILQGATATRLRLLEKSSVAKEPAPGIAKALVLPALLAILSFLLGQWTEQRKDVSTMDNSLLENRSKIFIAAASDFSVYLAHWSRLRTISEMQRLRDEDRKRLEFELAGNAGGNRKARLAELKDLGAELALISERKKTYIQRRDEAKDKLLGDIEQAKLFFVSAQVKAAIGQFEHFDAGQSNKRLKDLAPIESWRHHGEQMLIAMREEIQTNYEEKRNLRQWISKLNPI